MYGFCMFCNVCLKHFQCAECLTTQEASGRLASFLIKQFVSHPHRQLRNLHKMKYLPH